MKKTLFIKSALFLLMVSICPGILAQNQPSSPQVAVANELFKAQKWAEAASAYDEILKSQPSSGVALYQLGMARYSLKQYSLAAKAFEKYVSLSDSPFVMFNLACVYSLMGEKEKSLDWLAKTVDHPKMVLPAINFGDPDLTNIKDDPRFKDLAEKVDRKINPCRYSDEAKQFNFFIGEWDAYNPQGRHDGTSVIQSIAGGCGILENWRDSFGGEGKSINFYDQAAGKWFQYWIGRNGGPLRYSGIYEDGAIRYQGEPSVVNGKTILNRLTFFKIDQDTVRQFSESSSDDGGTWTPNYDLKYVRKLTKN
jgi:tetratricopeptide (TPR) repeat protein